jgi:predicted nucleotidyltransferase
MDKKQEIIEKYVSIKKKLQKIQGHDITNKDIYETVISIIEMYEMEYLNKYILEETNYNNIFKIIKTIRLTKEEFSLLETLIVIAY